MNYCLLCPICDTYLPIIETSKGKIYCVCKNCGLTVMIGNINNEKLLKKIQKIDNGKLTPENLAYYEDKLKKREYGRRKEEKSIKS